MELSQQPQFPFVVVFCWTADFISVVLSSSLDTPWWHTQPGFLLVTGMRDLVCLLRCLTLFHAALRYLTPALIGTQHAMFR